MSRVPSSKNNVMPVKQFTDTAYDNVEIVADNIEAVITAAGDMEVLTLYLGAHEDDPTEGYHGEPLRDGNFYLNTTAGTLRYLDLEDGVWVESDAATVIQAAKDAQAAQAAAELAQSLAETAQANAETAEANASTSEGNAAQSEFNAAQSEAAADTAKNLAEAAATTATSSESNSSAYAAAAAQSAAEASDSEGAALLSETNAAASEANSAESESNAAASAAASATSASESLTSATNAETAKTAAELAEANAATSESNAATSETNAAQSATNANTDSGLANASKNAAAASALAAADSETNAATSETNSGASETSALNSAAAAASSRSLAESYANSASADADQTAADRVATGNDVVAADADRVAAQAARIGAESAETNAANSETNAANSAADAATSESNANSNAIAAAGSASSAATSASNAATSESNADTSETNAATSEANALAEANRAATLVADLDDAYRSAGTFDAAVGSYPAPTDQTKPYNWFSTSTGTIGSVNWTEGDLLSYIPAATNPATTFGTYYRVGGELAAGGTPQPLIVPDDLIISEDKAFKAEIAPSTFVQITKVTSARRVLIGEAEQIAGIYPELNLVSNTKLYHTKALDVSDVPTERYEIITSEGGQTVPDLTVTNTLTVQGNEVYHPLNKPSMSDLGGYTQAEVNSALSTKLSKTTTSAQTMLGNLVISTDQDAPLTLNSLDDGWSYIAFNQETGGRKSYWGLTASGIPVWGRDSNALTVHINEAEFTFNAPLASPAPVATDHLTNKNYVDTAFNSLNTTAAKLADDQTFTGSNIFSRDGRTLSLRPATAANTSYIFMQNYDGTVNRGFIGYNTAANNMEIYNYLGDINLSAPSGAVKIQDPRSSDVQGTNSDSLTRKDYVDDQDATLVPLDGSRDMTGNLRIQSNYGIGTDLSDGPNGQVIITGSYGETQIGMGNSLYTHYLSDSGRHYFYGNVTVANYVSVADAPTDVSHLTRKDYVDNAITVAGGAYGKLASPNNWTDSQYFLGVTNYFGASGHTATGLRITMSGDVAYIQGLEDSANGNGNITICKGLSSSEELDSLLMYAADIYFSSVPRVSASAAAPSADKDLVTKEYADGLIQNWALIGHTHTEANITDLDKYTQAEVDAKVKDIYQDTGSTNDPDTTMKPYFLTNLLPAPFSGVYWHVTQKFYTNGTPTETTNRMQSAVQYNQSNGDCRFLTRSYYNGAGWTDWQMAINDHSDQLVDGIKTFKQWANFEFGMRINTDAAESSRILPTSGAGDGLILQAGTNSSTAGLFLRPNGSDDSVNFQITPAGSMRQAAPQEDAVNALTRKDYVDAEVAAVAAQIGDQWQIHTRGEADMEQMREEVKRVRAASGFDQYGLHRDTGSLTGAPVNEGMWSRADTDFVSRVAMGYPLGGSQVGGTSETGFPVTAIAGFISNLISVNQSNSGYGLVNATFPEAERGTRIFSKEQNARGTGQWYLDFRYDIDPKYGNVAPNDSIAVSRAFEGLVQNGDFRSGDNGAWSKGTGDGNTITIDEGLLTINKVGTHWSYIEQDDRLTVGEEYYMEFWSDNGSGQLYVQGGQYPFIRHGWNRIRFTADSTKAQFQTVQNTVYYIRGLSFRPVTEEVVVSRHDVVGAEFFLEEVSVTNPYVYPHGMIQSKATTMNGLTCVRSNRPGSYYAAHLDDLTNPVTRTALPTQTGFTAVGGYIESSGTFFSTGDNSVGGGYQTHTELVAGRTYELMFDITLTAQTDTVDIDLYNTAGVVSGDPLASFTSTSTGLQIVRKIKFVAGSSSLYWHLTGGTGTTLAVINGLQLTEYDSTAESPSAGLGVDFWAATDQEKIDMVSDHTNNIFLLGDGRVVQWRMRQRTFRGYGNGDWYNTDPTGDAVGFQTTPYLQPAVQGITDSVNDTFVFGEDVGGWYGITNATPIHDDPAIFRAGISGATTNDAGVNGECYLHVWARVPRLNIGAYHPSHNPRGTSQVVREDWTGWAAWESAVSSNTRTRGGCFQDYRENIDGLINTDDPVGSIDVGLSGRRDGRFFDVIYAGGMGGINDDRLGTEDGETLVQRAYSKAIDGSFRGQERQKFWRINRNVYPDSSSSVIYLHSAMGVTDRDDIVGGAYANDLYNVRGQKAWVKIVETGGATLTTGTVTGVWYECDIMPHPQYKHVALNPNTGTTRWIDSGNSNSLKLDIACAVYVDENNNSHTVSGLKNQIDVIGAPSDASGRPDVNAGWEGDWIGPSRGTSSYNWLSRVEFTTNMASNVMIILQQSGTSHYTRAIDQTRNRVTSIGTGGDVGIIDYNTMAHAVMDFATRKYSIGETEIDHVYATAHNNPERGGLLREAFLGIADAGYSSEHPHSEYRSMRRKTLLSSRLNASSGTREYEPVHSQVGLGVPGYNTQALKMVMHPFATTRKVGLNFVMNELRWVGTYSGIGVIDVNDTNQANDGVGGNLYRVQGTWNNALNFKLVKCLNGFAASWSDQGWLASGVDGEGRTVYKYATNPSGTPYLREFGTRGDFWGDRGTIWVPDLGIETFDDELDTTVMSAQMILSKPIGYTKNIARVGEQLNGVDL